MAVFPVFFFLQKWYFAGSWGFLRYTQCIRTLLLSYQNQQSDNFLIFHLKGGRGKILPL